MDNQNMNTEEINEQANFAPEAPAGKKSSKKIWLIIAAVLVVVAIIVVIVVIPSHFEQVKSEAVHIAGQITSDDNSFTIDTNPYNDTNMDPTLVALLAPDAQENALEAIKYVNEELGFSSSLYDDMVHTSALMGRQSEENDKYRVSWTYHPDDGLEVTYYDK